MRRISNILSIFIILNFSCFFANAQNKKPIEFNLSCDSLSNTQMDTLTLSGNIVRYKIISTHKLYKKGTFEFFESNILLPDFDSQSDKKYIKNVLNKIGASIYTNEFIAFKDCIAREIYYQAIFPTKKQKKYLKKNLIGYFKVVKE